MSVVVDEQLVAQAFRSDHKAFVTIRSEADDFTNDSIASDLHRRKSALGIGQSECVRACDSEECPSRERSAQKTSAGDFRQHGNGRLQRLAGIGKKGVAAYGSMMCKSVPPA